MKNTTTILRGDPDLYKSERVAYHAGGQLISGILQEKLPFYLATLFHIGRQWKISKSLGREASRLLDSKNLASSVRNLLEFAAKAERPLGPEQARAAVAEFASFAGGQHERSLAKARSWWTVWMNEVAELRRLVETFAEQSPRRSERRDRDSTVSSGWLSAFSEVAALAAAAKQCSSSSSSRGGGNTGRCEWTDADDVGIGRCPYCVCDGGDGLEGVRSTRAKGMAVRLSRAA